MKIEVGAGGTCTEEPDEASVPLQCQNTGADDIKDVSPTGVSLMVSSGNYGDSDGVLRTESGGGTGSGSEHVTHDQDTPPMHPLLSGGSMPPLSGPLSQQQQQITTATGNGGSEVELARRLGVRFDSSNAAWVARWVEPHSEKKKSRWFSVAKYGELSARRLAIQACLQNMKPSDFPSLRDLQDVLASFTANPPSAGGGPGGSYSHGLVSGADIAASGSQQMANVVRGSGIDNLGNYGGNKMATAAAAQYIHPHQIMHAQHPFAIHGVPSPVSNYMAAVAAAGGMGGMASSPHTAAQLNGVFCQGVPQNQAAAGYCLDTGEEDVAGNPTAPGESVEGDAMEVPKIEDAGPMNGKPWIGDPTEVAVPGYLMSQAQVSSHDSSSDLETRSAVSDEDDDDLDSQDKGSDYEADGVKRKKRKMEQDGARTTVEMAQLAAASAAGQGGLSMGVFGNNNQQAAAAAGMHPSYYSLYHPSYQHPFMHQMGAGQNNPMSFLPPGYPLSLLHHHLHPHAGGFLPHIQGHLDMTQSGEMVRSALADHQEKPSGTGAGMYMAQGGHFSQQQPGTVGGSPTSGASPGVEGGAGFGGGAGGAGGSYKRITSGSCHHGGTGSSASSGASAAEGGPGSMTAKMTCERGLHYSKCYRGSQECWIAVWNTKGGRIMHEAFDVAQMGFEQAKAKAREARDAAHSNNVAVSENSRPSWKSHSNTGIPHVSLDSQQLRFRAHKFGRRLCRSFSFGRRRGSYASRENAFDAAVLWLIQTPTEDEIAAVSGRGEGT